MKEKIEIKYSQNQKKSFLISDLTLPYIKNNSFFYKANDKIIEFEIIKNQKDNYYYYKNNENVIEKLEETLKYSKPKILQIINDNWFIKEKEQEVKKVFDFANDLEDIVLDDDIFLISEKDNKEKILLQSIFNWSFYKAIINSDFINDSDYEVKYDFNLDWKSVSLSKKDVLELMLNSKKITKKEANFIVENNLNDNWLDFLKLVEKRIAWLNKNNI